jgi:hypothetical protein
MLTTTGHRVMPFWHHPRHYAAVNALGQKLKTTAA